MIEQANQQDIAGKESSAASVGQGGKHRCLGFALLNGLLVTAFAQFHMFSISGDSHWSLSFRSYFSWILLETAVLFSPAVLVYALLHWQFPRVARLLCVTCTVAISAIYFLDLAVFLSLREHFLSKVFYDLTRSVLPFIFDYLSLANLLTFAAFVVGWIIVQFGCWKLTTNFGREKRHAGHVGPAATVALLAIASAPIAFLLAPAFAHWDRTLAEVVLRSDRHPITATGFFEANRAPKLKRDNVDAIRGEAWMIAKHQRISQLVSRYDGFAAKRIEGASKPLPDVMLIVSECLRPDLITGKTAPNIRKRAEQGLWLQQHYTAGNHSRLGFFGLMFGLDGFWYENKHQLPTALFEGLKQVGYTTGFFGRDCFHTFGMDTFCGEQCFDMYDFPDDEDIITCDRKVCQSAKDYFERTGRFADNPEAPRLAIVYLYAPHDYRCEAEDDIHTTADSDASGISGVYRSRYTRFLNSIHFVDRIVGRLLSDDRLTFIVGDHGESFGEDQRGYHGTAVSKVQTQTCGVAFGPGIPKRIITAPTSHCDVLPTVAQLLEIEYSTPHLFHGVSLLEPIPDDRIVSARSFSSFHYLFVKPNRQPGDRELGYQGFLDLKNYIMAPGGTVDINSDILDGKSESEGKWSDASLMVKWMKDRLGPDFATIPDDPAPPLRKAIAHADPLARSATIRLIRAMGPRAVEFIPELQECLLDEDEKVRDEAFRLLHAIHRRQ